MERNITFQTVVFTIPAGRERFRLPKTTLDDGKAIRAAIHLEGNTPTQLISLSLLTGGNTTLVEPSSIKDWQQRAGGDYLSSLKPLPNVKGGTEVMFEFTSVTALAAELKGQIMIVIDQDC